MVIDHESEKAYIAKRLVFQFMLIAVLPLAIATTVPAAEPLYQGKTLRVVVASAAGGGSDIVGRLIMRHLSRHIPGTPTIIIENMPGAGEVIGVNYVHNFILSASIKPSRMGSQHCSPRERRSRNCSSFPASNSIFCKCPLSAAGPSPSPPLFEPKKPE